MQWPSHGSNPRYLYESMNIPIPDDYIDFSANINPLGPPQNLERNWTDYYHRIHDYPDPYALSLKKQIAEKENINMGSILIGNGGAELITLIGRMLSRKNVLIIEPAFSEYEKACRSNDCQIFYHYKNERDWNLKIEELVGKIENVDAVFLCNPNNPTGVYDSYKEVLQLLEACKQRDVFLIVDEAFYDFLEDYRTITPLLKEYSNLIILRSMTKMYAIPGLRLGYSLAHSDVIEKLTAYQSHWSVNVLAMLAGEECLRDGAFIGQTREYIRIEREKLFAFFREERFDVSKALVNFYLLRDPEVEEQLPFFEFLLRNGIVPRHTVNFPGLEGRWLRFAIKSTDENQRLMEVLREWRHPH